MRFRRETKVLPCVSVVVDPDRNTSAIGTRVQARALSPSVSLFSVQAPPRRSQPPSCSACMSSRCGQPVVSSSSQRGSFHLEASAAPQQQWRPKPRKIPCPKRPSLFRKAITTTATTGSGEALNRRRTKSYNTSKLQELKLAFGLLSKEIQGLDGEEGDQCLPCPPAAATEGEMQRNEASKPLTPAVKNTDIPPSDVATEEAPQQSHGGLAAAANLPAKKAATSHPDVQQRSNEAADGLNRMRGDQRSNAATQSLDRVRASSHAEGRKAAEAAAKQAKKSLKQLDLELEKERRARTAAER